MFTTGKKPSPRELDSCIQAVAEGQNDSMERLYACAGPSVYAYALSVTRNVPDAEDITHDCFVKIYDAAPSYVSHGKPMAWILTIAKNLCFAGFNVKRRFADVSDEELHAQFATNSAMDVEDKLVVVSCLSKLAEDERQIVVLHSVAGMKHREIAKIMEIPLSTTLSKYKRALEKLKAIITKEQ